VGVSAYKDVKDACAVMVRKVQEYEPNPEGVAEYERLYPIFRELYPSLKDTYAALAKFEN
jgi:xylulokinase